MCPSSTEQPASDHPAPADGLDLLGEVDGSGYQQGAALVRRADGQMVQLGPLLYALLEELDGERDYHELSVAMEEKLGRACDEQHVAAITEKLAQQGLVAGSETHAPAPSNPLLALRWKVVVTDPELTRRLTAPFTVLFRPWVVVPVLAAFLVTCWFVVVEHGVASGFAQAFERPELFLLLVGLGIAAAGFHELGHATACRFGGGTPGAMGAGIYLVWPAFYTDVTDAYRLPTRDRLRTDLGGLYFNAIVAVATIAAWLVLRMDSLLLLIGLQLVAMLKQLSPIIRADGYHILSDITGVPDLYAHIGPTLRSLLPGRRPTGPALTGRARLIVAAWVLVVVPILLGVALGAILLLPKVAASAWDSGAQLIDAMSGQVRDGRTAELFVSLVRMLGLALPVAGMALIAQRLVTGVVRRATAWSRGRPARRGFVVAAALAGAALLVWAWWPSGQYDPIRASDGGRIGQVGQLVSTKASATTGVVPSPDEANAAPVDVPPGTYVAISLIPEGGATETNPAVFVITDPTGEDRTPIVIASSSAPTPGETPDEPTSDAPATTTASAFTFRLPDAPEEGDTQALAVNRTDGATMYSIAYSLVTVRDGDDVDQQNSAHAYANCVACTTVAVSFQVVLVVGSSSMVAPVNLAEALNGNCPACVTTAIANQIVVSIGTEPSDELLAELNAELERLDAIDDLGADTSPDAIAAQVDAVQAGINQVLVDAGLLPASEEQDSETAPVETDATDEPATSETTTDPTDPDATTTDDASTEPSTDTTSDATTDDPADPASTTTTTTETAPTS